MLILQERYCRQVKQTNQKHSANYYNSIVDKSNRTIIDTVLTIRTAL
jgi:hypothetical protein